MSSICSNEQTPSVSSESSVISPAEINNKFSFSSKPNFEDLQWKGEVKEGLHDWKDEDKEHLAQELSDVLIHLLRLSEKCHIDLPTAVLNKMRLNELKYPSSKVSGCSKKYNEYSD